MYITLIDWKRLLAASASQNRLDPAAALERLVGRQRSGVSIQGVWEQICILLRNR